VKGASAHTVQGDLSHAHIVLLVLLVGLANDARLNSLRGRRSYSKHESQTNYEAFLSARREVR
jgi:hypothetical protein